MAASAAFHSRLAATSSLPLVERIDADDAIILVNEAANPRFDRSNASTLLLGDDSEPYHIDDAEANRKEREVAIQEVREFGKHNKFQATPDEDSTSDEDDDGEAGEVPPGGGASVSSSQAGSQTGKPGGGGGGGGEGGEGGEGGSSWWKGDHTTSVWRPIWEEDEFSRHVVTADLTDRG